MPTLASVWPKKSYCIMFWLDWSNKKWCHCQWHLCHVMLTLVPTASYNKRSGHTLFQLSSPNEENGAIDHAISTSFCSLWPHEYNGTTDNTTGITEICQDSLDMCRYLKTCLVIVWKHLDIVNTGTHIWTCLDTSRHCSDITVDFVWLHRDMSRYI